MELVFKPRIIARKTFRLPPGVVVWCHPCNVGFSTLQEGREHMDTTQHAQKRKQYAQKTSS